MKTITLNVPGMSCSHCEMAISGAVKGLDGVESVNVNLNDKIVTVTYDSGKLAERKIKSAIEEQGYDIE